MQRVIGGGDSRSTDRRDEKRGKEGGTTLRPQVFVNRGN
jgi:hypothetical protein